MWKVSVLGVCVVFEAGPGVPGLQQHQWRIYPLKASCSPLASLRYCQLENTLLILFTRYLFI